ncbi:MAG: VWA containing CoxE family protein [Planctomycetaceae bacterium]|nr:VWA containing CoxE family protein [Planctomycetaceae bacterium]
MFVDFFYHLRRSGLKVTITEWLALTQSLVMGHGRADLSTFYHLARCLLVKRETDYDTYDQAFASFFRGVEEDLDITEDLLDWLKDPVLPDISDEDRAKLAELELDDLLKRFRALLEEQTERHDGGSRWIGTGGTSPFGHGGQHPTGIRVGGAGGGRSAVQVAESRQFRNLRSDRILDTRQIAVALRRLRRLGKIEGPEELDVDESVDASARNAGEIELVFTPPKRNRIKLMLLMDVGGSMDPYTVLCERLFSAAHAANHFKEFEHRFFHNCVYGQLYTDISRWQGEPTADVLNRLDHTWSVVFVGDAWMAAYELTHVGGTIGYYQRNTRTGIEWLQQIRQRVPNSVWLNPVPKKFWTDTSIHLIHSVFPMFELSIDGLTEATDVLRGTRPNRPYTAVARGGKMRSRFRYQNQ